MEKEIAWIKVEYKDGTFEYMDDINLFEPYAILQQEKQELISCLKERINKCDKNIKIHNKEISKFVDVREYNRHVILRKRFKVEKQVYEEILSKIEKR